MEKLELKEKAYVINTSNLSEPWFANNEPCYGTIGQAKLEILSLNDGHKNNDHEDIDFLNIKIIRAKEYDKYLFEGNTISFSAIKEINQDRKRNLILENILTNENVSHCYIRKGSYYRPNSCGYTDMINRAGIYLKKDAVSKAKSCKDLYLVSIDNSVHNKMIQDEIDDLKTRLIN